MNIKVDSPPTTTTTTTHTHTHTLFSHLEQSRIHISILTILFGHCHIIIIAWLCFILTLESIPNYIGVNSELHWSQFRITLESIPNYIGSNSELHWFQFQIHWCQFHIRVTNKQFIILCFYAILDASNCIYTISKSYYSLLPNSTCILFCYCNLNSKIVCKALKVASISVIFSIVLHFIIILPYVNRNIHTKTNRIHVFGGTHSFKSFMLHTCMVSQLKHIHCSI